MSEAINLMPNKWVSESVLMAVTGLKKNTIKTARETSWMEGREYRHVAPDNQPRDNSPCFYNREEVDRWIEKQPPATKRRKSA